MHFFVNMLFQEHCPLSVEETEGTAPISPVSLERVLWIDPSNTYLATIDSAIEHHAARPVIRSIAQLESDLEAGRITPVVRDPYQRIYLPDEDLPPAYLQKRDASWALVQMILTKVESPERLFDAQLLGPIISEIHAQTGKAKSTLYRLLRYYWQKGQVANALLPNFDRCGAPGRMRHSGLAKRGAPSTVAREKGVPTGVNVDDAVKAAFRQGIQLYYETRACRTLKEAWLRTLQTFFAVGEKTCDGVTIPVLPPWQELPTENQFRYWYYQEYQPMRALVKRQGEHAYQVKNRAALGSLKLNSFGPGSLYLIDATIADLHLVSAMNRNRLIGRPVIYFVLDVFSGLIVGMSVSLEGPSWIGAMQALENMVLDKVAFCKEYGRTIRPEDWPSMHLPHAILADRGELLSPRIDTFLKTFHIAVANTAPYRPDWKGELEHQFCLLNEAVIQWQPGAIREREPGRPDYRLDASLTLRGFRRLLIDYVIEHNTTREAKGYHLDPAIIAEGISPVPCELWKWGIQNCSGILRKESLNNVRLALMPRETARVTREGIHFGKLHYTCPLAEQEDWFGAVRRGKPSWSLPILHDPRSSEHIFLLLHEGKDLEACTVVEKEQRFRRWDWFDVEEYFAVRSHTCQTQRSFTMQQRVEHYTRRDALTREEIQQTNEVKDRSLSNAARTKQVKEQKEAERQHERQQSAWRPVDSSSSAASPRQSRASSPPPQDAILRGAQEELYGRP